MGRPDILTAQKFELARKCLTAALSIKGTCRVIKISRATWYDWKKRSESKNPTEDELKYVDFFEMVEEALGNAELKLVADINKDKSWQSSEKILKRRFNEDWGEIQTIETRDLNFEDKLKANADIDIDKLSDEDQEALALLLEKAKPEEDEGDADKEVE